MSSAATIAVGASVAGGIASSAMGGGGGGISQESRYTPGQQRMMNYMTGRLEDELGQGVESYDKPVEEQIPGLTEGQQRAQEYGRDYLGEGAPLDQQTETGKELLQGSEWQPKKTRQRWQEQVMEPMRQEWQEETAPMVTEEFASRNALSSSGLNKAMAESAQQIQEEGQRELSDMMFKSWRENRQRDLRKKEMGSSLLGQTLQQARAASGLTQPQREVEAKRQAELKQRWSKERPYNNPWLNKFYGPTMGVQPQENVYKKEEPGMLQSALGSFSKGMMSYGTSSLGNTLSNW